MKILLLNQDSALKFVLQYIHLNISFLYKIGVSWNSSSITYILEEPLGISVKMHKLSAWEKQSTGIPGSIPPLLFLAAVLPVLWGGASAEVLEVRIGMLGCVSPDRPCRSDTELLTASFAECLTSKVMCAKALCYLGFYFASNHRTDRAAQFRSKLEPQKLSLVSQLFCSVFLSSFFLVSFLEYLF